MEYKTWRDSVIRIMINQRLINPDQSIADDIYIAYYEDGYSPVQAIKEDIGEDSIIYLNKPCKEKK